MLKKLDLTKVWKHRLVLFAKFSSPWVTRARPGVVPLTYSKSLHIQYSKTTDWVAAKASWQSRHFLLLWVGRAIDMKVWGWNRWQLSQQFNSDSKHLKPKVICAICFACPYPQSEKFYVVIFQERKLIFYPSPPTASLHPDLSRFTKLAIILQLFGQNYSPLLREPL